MKHEDDQKEMLDRISGTPENQARFALKAMLLTERISFDTMEKALDLAAHIKTYD